MPWSSTDTIPAMKNKSLELRKLFASVANAALDRGQSEEEAVFAGLAAVKLKEKRATAKATQNEPKPKLPQHIQAILDLKKQSEQATTEASALKIQQPFLGKNALVPDSERSLVNAQWDRNGRLILTFDDGKQIVTDPVPVSENIEQFVTISSGGSAELPSEFDHIQFSQTPVGPSGIAKLQWNDTDGTLEFGLKGGNVTLQIGQEEVVHIYNNTAVDFTDMQVVRITGSQGQRLTADLARANAESTSSTTIAVVTESILKNSVGFATVSGLVRNVDTSAFPEGAALYLSATTNGAITHIRPAAPNHTVLIGWCVRSHHVNGSIYVHIQNGLELGELHDVLINNPVNGQALVYDAVLGVWKNQPVSGAGGLRLEHVQSTPSSTWTINHNFGFKPAVQILSAGGLQMTGTVQHLSNDTLHITFNTSVSGSAILN